MAAAPAPPAGKGKRKRELSEDDVYLLLHRYTPTAILTALQEVAQHAERRNIDWRALVAKTATGITCPREYQMLWRHFAYRHDLAENVDPCTQPLVDESDLECEIEPVPTPSNEAVAEASGFAKILLSGSSREQAFTHRINAEAPVLSTPNEKIPRVPSDKQLAQGHRLTNGTGPVSNSKQASHTGLSLDPFDGNGAHKKKKKPKPWSKEEDADLMAGVYKFGEGNWLNILHQYNFDSTRTHVQLSQRWALISKRQGITKLAYTKPVSGNLDRKAAQMAFSMALDMPMRKAGLSTSRSGASQSSVQHASPVFGNTAPEVKSVTASSSSLPVPVPVPVPVQVQLPLPQVQQAPAQAAPLKVSNTSNKSRNKKQTAQPNPANAPSSIQAAAIAAGGRIATPSVATNLLKAAQSRKAVHIRFRGPGSSKTSTSSKTPTMTAEPGTQLGSAQHPESSSALTRSPVATTHATEQILVVSEVAEINPPEQSAGAHLLEANRTLSTTIAVSDPCVNVEMDDDSTFCVVTMEDLFPEDVNLPDVVDPKSEEIIDPKDADMLEFDRFVARGCMNVDSLDKSKTVKNAPEDQGVAVSQKKQPKLLSAAGRSIPVFSRTAATGKNTKNLAPQAISPPTGAPSGLVGTGNAGVLSKALCGKPAAPGTTARQKITGQKQQPMNTKSNGMPNNLVLSTGTPAKNAALSTGTPAKNASLGTGTPAKNAALGTGTLAKNAALSTGTAARGASPNTGIPAKNLAISTGTPAKNLAPSTGTPAKNLAVSTGTPAKNLAPSTGTPAKNLALNTGTSAKGASPNTGTAAKNSAPSTGTPAKNLAPSTGTPAKNASPSTGTPAKNTAFSCGVPARSVVPSTATPANRQGNPAVNGASKRNPPGSL